MGPPSHSIWDPQMLSEGGFMRPSHKILFFILFYKIRLGEETIRGHTIGTRTPLLTFGNVLSLSLSCAMIISLRSTIFSPSQGRTTLLHKITIYYMCSYSCDAFKWILFFWGISRCFQMNLKKSLGSYKKPRIKSFLLCTHTFWNHNFFIYLKPKKVFWNHNLPLHSFLRGSVISASALWQSRWINNMRRSLE